MGWGKGLMGLGSIERVLCLFVTISTAVGRAFCRWNQFPKSDQKGTSPQCPQFKIQLKILSKRFLKQSYRGLPK